MPVRPLGNPTVAVTSVPLQEVFAAKLVSTSVIMEFSTKSLKPTGAG